MGQMQTKMKKEEPREREREKMESYVYMCIFELYTATT